MTEEFAMALTQELLYTAILISAPILGLSMLVGLIISAFQVVTQLQEMSLTFVPKILTVAIVLIVFGPWMLSVLVRFSREMIGNVHRFIW